MKKRNLLIAASLFLLTLSACNPNEEPVSSSVLPTPSSSDTVTSSEESQSTSSEEEIPDNKITYNDAARLLDNTMISEALKSNKVNVVSTTIANSLKDIKEEKFEIFNDKTSASEGTVKLLENDKVTKETTFKSRNIKTVDKIMNEGKVCEYNVFASAIDYEDDNYGRYLVDQASRIFIVGSDQEAHAGGLEEGQYIVDGAYPVYASRHVSKDLKDFMLTNIIANPSLGAIGTPLMTIDIVGNTFVYTGDLSYSYEGDLNDTITERIETKFILDATREKLLSTECKLSKLDVNNNDENDKYVSSTGFEATLSYDKREEAKGDLINVDDYFLESVTDVQMYQSLNGYQEVSSNQITLDGTYLRAKAKTYTPSKAIETSLRCVNSSHPEVISVAEDGTMEVLAKGTTELTFCYNGKEDGVYVLKEIKKQVSVVDSKVEKVSIMYNSDVLEGYINEGETVKFNTCVSPTKCSQEVTVTTDHPEILDVKVEDGDKVVVTGKAPGKAKITVASIQDPSKIDVKELEVISKDVDFKSLIIASKYESKSLYTGTIYSISFFENGTGKLVAKPVSGSEVTFNFEYTVERNRITFANWDSETDVSLAFKTAQIVGPDAHLISCYTDWENVDEGGISLNIMDFKLKAGK